jgi:hypothetical protein
MTDYDLTFKDSCFVVAIVDSRIVAIVGLPVSYSRCISINDMTFKDCRRAGLPWKFFLKKKFPRKFSRCLWLRRIPKGNCFVFDNVDCEVA